MAVGCVGSRLVLRIPKGPRYGQHPVDAVVGDEPAAGLGGCTGRSKDSGILIGCPQDLVRELVGTEQKRLEILNSAIPIVQRRE